MLRADVLNAVRSDYRLAQIGKGTEIETCAFLQMLYPSYVSGVPNSCEMCYLHVFGKWCMSYVYDMAK